MAKPKNKDDDPLKVFKDAESSKDNIIEAVFELQATEEDVEAIVDVEHDMGKELSLMEKAIAAQGQTTWDVFREQMEGPLAEKAMRIMAKLPDAEFLRQYNKFIEYFKPKVTRTQPLDGGNDTTININIVSIGAKGETKIIDITEHDD
jgi:hypothetical protein